MTREKAIELKLKDIIRITNTPPHVVSDEVINKLASQALALLKPAVCGDCKHFMYCTHERKTTHNKRGECSDWLLAPSGQAKAGEFTKRLRNYVAEMEKKNLSVSSLSILDCCTHIDRLEADLKDIELELSTPETMICAQEKEPLYKWAATIVCRKIELEAENKRLKEAAEMKSYDLLISNYYSKSRGDPEDKSVEVCSICGQRPHKKDCKYWQLIDPLQGQKGE